MAPSTANFAAYNLHFSFIPRRKSFAPRTLSVKTNALVKKLR
jgi:hypothetical protein